MRIGAKVVKGDGHAPAHGKGNPFGGINDTPREEHYFKEEVVEDWDCCPDCPIAIMDSQSGDNSSTRIGNPNSGNKGGKMFGGSEQTQGGVVKRGVAEGDENEGPLLKVC